MAVRCDQCGGSSLVQWGSYRRRCGEAVRRLRCRTCGATRLGEAKTAEAGLEVGRERLPGEQRSRLESFWARVASRLGSEPWPRALARASAEVGIDRTTGWRWARDHRVEALDVPAGIRREEWDLALLVAREYRRGHNPEPALADPAGWAFEHQSPRPSGFYLRAPDDPKRLVEAILEATAVGAAIEGRLVPVWAERLADEYGLPLPSGVNRRGWGRELFHRQLSQPRERLMAEAPPEWWESSDARRWLEAWGEQGISEALLEAINRGWSTGVTEVPEELRASWRPWPWLDVHLTHGLPRTLEAWMRGRSAPEPIDDSEARALVERCLMAPVRTALCRALQEEARSEPMLLDLRPDELWVGARAGRGRVAWAQRSLPPAYRMATREVLYPGAMRQGSVHGEPHVVIPRPAHEPTWIRLPGRPR